MTDLAAYEEAAARYRPSKVKLLWIAEAPPLVNSGDEPRYFYFEKVTRHDSLFREVMRAMFPCSALTGYSKAPLLRRFREEGAFLIDVCKDPAEPWRYAKWWPTTQREIEESDPEHIIAVKVGVCDFVYGRLDSMGMGDRLLTRDRIPFPGSGQQGKFHEIVDPLLRELGIPQCDGGC
jgi:hypothetical protein